MTLLISEATRFGLFMCPFCQYTFSPPKHEWNRQLLVALDVSTSVVPHLAEMLRHTASLQHRHAREQSCEMRIFTFHYSLLPFPCERLSHPQRGDSIVLPTLRDLRGRVAPGSAVLDALYQLLIETGAESSKSYDVVMLTDGGDRNSHRHPEEVRRQIRQAEGRTNVHILSFGGSTRMRPLIRLMRLLATPGITWSFHNSRFDISNHRFPWPAKRSDRWNLRGRSSCR